MNIEVEKVFTERGFTNIEQMATMFDWYKEEIERLKQGYCELKEKCNKGECDCTHEEYNGMCEENIKMDLEIERLNDIIEQTQKILYIKLMNENKEKIYIQEVIDIIENLKGSDKE